MKRSSNPREKRALTALLNGPIMRENLDIVVGCSNGPDLITRLRGKGLKVPCERVERFDKDGNSCWPGRYSFTPDDRALAREMLGAS